MRDTLSQTCRRKFRRTPLAIAMASAISLAVLPGILLAEPEQDTNGPTDVAEPDIRLQELTNDYRNLEERHAHLEEELERAESEREALEERLADSESERETLEARVSEVQQQRLQAEEALAATTSEAVQARAELDDVHAQRQSLESERDSLQQELMEVRDELEASEQARQTLESDIASMEERADSLETELAEIRTERDERDAELAEVRTERDEREAELAEVRTERDERDAELAEVRAERDERDVELAEARYERDVLYRDTVTPLQAEVERLRSLLPSAEGGELDLDSARQAASEQAARLRTAHETLRRGRSDADDPQAEYDAMVADLHREQSLVTRVQGGTLYTLQSGETLGDVARRYYGDANRWPAIYQANQHVIENPDRVVPGLTVILP